MLKLLLSENVITQALIKHCTTTPGTFSYSIATNYCIRNSGWGPVRGFSKLDSKEFLNLLKSEGIKYRIVRELASWSNTGIRECYIKVDRI